VQLYLASGCTPYVTPTGMVMPYLDPKGGTPWDARARYKNTFSFMQATLSHSYDGGSEGGQASFNNIPNGLAMLTALNLRNDAGANFDPANYKQIHDWLLNGTAVNMAYMLSVQMTAMTLNVASGGVNGARLIYAPGTNSANQFGYASVSAILSEANASLGANGSTPSGSAARSYQESLKNALDAGNNNLNFVQTSPCAFSFAQ